MIGLAVGVTPKSFMSDCVVVRPNMKVPRTIHVPDTKTYMA